MAVSSLSVCAYTYLAYAISPLAVEFTQWILLLAKDLRAGRFKVWPRVYTRACFNNWSPVSSTEGVTGSRSRSLDPAILRGK